MISNTQGPAVSAGPITLLMNLVRRMDQASYWVVVAVMAAMAILVAAQVFFRYALSSSIDSADELSRLFFVWSMFMAIPHGIKIGIHVGIDLMVRQFSENLREFLFRLMSAASAVLMVIVFYVTIFVTADKWQDLMPTIDVTAAVYYIPVLLSAGHSFLHLVVLTWGGSKIWQEASS
ncbi:MAG: TRAP transporter small permease [Rhodospirillales bacterium]|jgi:TRAP-type transport system small permease protein|nr:TRAP transporter small permease [Rhodospirillales bacterium]